MKKKLVCALLMLALLCCAVFAMTTTASAAAPGYVKLGAVTLNDGYYLKEGSTTPTTTKPSSGGYAYYKDGVLQLYNFDVVSTDTSNGIYTNSGDLIIELVGASTIKSAQKGIYTKGALTVRGSGSLTVTATGNDYGAYIKGKCTIEGGTLNITATGANADAVYVDETYTQKAGSVTLKSATRCFVTYGYTYLQGGSLTLDGSDSGSYSAWHSYNDITITNGDLTITTAGTGISSDVDDVLISGSAVIKIDVDGHGIKCKSVSISDVEQLLISAGSSSKAFYVNSLYLGTGLACSGSQTNNGNNAYALTSSNAGLAKYAYIRSDIDLYVGGIPMSIGDYLHESWGAASTYKPSDNYARVDLNGDTDELYLKNFNLDTTSSKITSTAISTSSSLKLYLDGTNYIKSGTGDAICINKGSMQVISGGTLNINTTSGIGINLKSGDYIHGGNAIINITSTNGTGVNLLNQNITVNSGELNVTAKYDGIHCVNFTITGGKVDTRSTNNENNKGLSYTTISYGSLTAKAATTVDGALVNLTSAHKTANKRVYIGPASSVPTNPTTAKPTTAKPTTAKPTTAKPTTAKPTTAKPATVFNISRLPIIYAGDSLKSSIAKSAFPDGTTFYNNQYGFTMCDGTALSLPDDIAAEGNNYYLFAIVQLSNYSSVPSGAEFVVMYGDTALPCTDGKTLTKDDEGSFYKLYKTNDNKIVCQIKIFLGEALKPGTTVKPTTAKPTTAPTTATPTTPQPTTHQHIWTDTWDETSTEGHSHFCEECDAVSTPEAHVPNIPAATETEDQKCTLCGFVMQKKIKHIHMNNLTKVAAKPASCTTDGNVEYYTCTCGKWFLSETALNEIVNKEDVKIPADHSYGTVIQGFPPIHTQTELKDGQIAYYQCSVCMKYFDVTKDEVTSLTIPAGDHEYTIINGYKGADGHANTCACGKHEAVKKHTPDITAPTEAKDQKCTQCGYVIAPALGHVHKEHLTKVAATSPDCQKTGNTEYYACSCGKFFKDAEAKTEITDKSSVILPATDHTYVGEWQSNASVHWRECVCGEKGNMADHADTDENGKCDTCNFVMPQKPSIATKPAETVEPTTAPTVAPSIMPSTAPGGTADGGEEAPNLLWLWIVIAVVAVSGIVLFIVLGKKKKEQ